MYLLSIRIIGSPFMGALNCEVKNSIIKNERGGLKKRLVRLGLLGSVVTTLPKRESELGG